MTPRSGYRESGIGYTKAAIELLQQISAGSRHPGPFAYIRDNEPAPGAGAEPTDGCNGRQKKDFPPNVRA
ncbi:MAG: hypothetical protein C0606_15875 [Hyphomicrobiales bacterium]|nr:MAG: hypothetical protein C0606_15875 [Hyphomicrobiales bacterium]